MGSAVEILAAIDIASDVSKSNFKGGRRKDRAPCDCVNYTWCGRRALRLGHAPDE